MSLVKGLLYSIIFFNLIRFSFSYVECDDGVSACDSGQICCLTLSGKYSCCKNTLYCCQDGTYCCKYSNLANKIFVTKSTPPSIHPLIEGKVISESEEDSSVSSGIMEILNNFLSKIGYHKRITHIELCKKEMFNIIQNSIQTFAQLNLRELNYNSLELLTQSSEKFGLIFNQVKYLMSQCEKLSDAAKYIFNLVLNNLESFQTLKNFFDKIKYSFPDILNLIRKIQIKCNETNYQDCGLALGELFNIVMTN